MTLVFFQFMLLVISIFLSFMVIVDFLREGDVIFVCDFYGNFCDFFYHFYVHPYQLWISMYVYLIGVAIHFFILLEFLSL